MKSDSEAVVATIVSASGSTPAPGQSKMLIRTRKEYATIGTVGGGCLDVDVIESVREATPATARVATYTLNDDDGDTGLTCGGTVHVLVEAIDSSMTPIYEEICRRKTNGRSSYLMTKLAGAQSKSLFDEHGGFLRGSPVSEAEMKKVTELTSGEGRESSHMTEEFALEYIEPRVRVIIFGGGHVGKVTSRCGALAGFSITIVDDRAAYANRERFPEADEIHCKHFDDAIPALTITAGDYVVIVTRGHKYDEMILERVLPFEPRYIGMIGSRRKVQLSYEKLMARGISREALAKVHAPIGLEIGAETADEIGVSIIAEIIGVRRGVQIAVK
ncbi:MAG TPA: XdhC family protein [Bacteroidota bacterium]|nr:XdhC family protein [Bacteroidota bacterium]